jgi:hypothetical protein
MRLSAKDGCNNDNKRLYTYSVAIVGELVGYIFDGKLPRRYHYSTIMAISNNNLIMKRTRASVASYHVTW